MNSKDTSLDPNNIVPPDVETAEDKISDKWTKALNNNAIDAISRVRTKKKHVLANIDISKNTSITVDPETHLTDATNQFLNAIIVLWNQTPGHENNYVVGINLLDYMKLKGIEDTPNNRKNTSRRIKQLSANLYTVSVKTILKNNKGREFNYDARILQSKAVARDGNSYLLKLTDDFFNAMVTAAYVMPIPIKLLRLDTSRYKYTWRIGYYLTRYQKMVIQHNHPQEDVLESITDMNTLLGKIDILNQKGRNIYDRIIKRVIRALDQLSHELQLFDYYITDTHGAKITYFKELPLDEFKTYKLHVKWRDYPKDWVPLAGRNNNH